MAFSVSGEEANQFGLSLNDEIIPGSVYGVRAGTQQNAGSLVVEMQADDRLRLRNVGDAEVVTLTPDIGGKHSAVNAAVTITRLPDAKTKD